MSGGSGRPAASPAPTGRRPAPTSGAPASPGAPPIDPAVVDSLRRLGQRSGRDVLGELTSLFLSTAESQLDTAWDLLDARDYVQLARVAHSLKGSSSVIGGRSVSAAAADLEERAAEARDALASRGSDSLGSDSGGTDSVGDPEHDAAARAALATFVSELERFRSAVEDLNRPS